MEFVNFEFIHIKVFIGPQGSNIKKLKEHTGCSFHVFTDEGPPLSTIARAGDVPRRAASSTRGSLQGHISQYTPASRIRRAIKSVYWLP